MDEDLKRVLSFKCNEFLLIVMQYVIPALQISVVIVNCVNFFAFLKSKSFRTSSIHRYLTAYSMLEVIVFTSYIFATQPVCNQQILLSYAFQTYSLYVVLYLTRVLSMISTLINIKILINKYIFFKDSVLKNKYQDAIKGYLIMFTVFSLIFYLPNLIFNKIYNVRDLAHFKELTPFLIDNSIKSDSYIIFFNEFVQKHKEIKLILFLTQNFSTIIVLIMTITFNVLIYKHYKSRLQNTNGKIVLRYLKNKKIKLSVILNNSLIDVNVDGSTRKNRQMTLMILWISSVFIVDQVLISVGSTVYLVFGRLSFIQSLVMANVLIGRSLCALSTPAFYYAYNSEYRNLLKAWLGFACKRKKSNKRHHRKKKNPKTHL